MRELMFFPAIELAELVRTKKVSPVELAEAHLAQIQKLNPKLNAVVQVEPECVRRQAHAAEIALAQGEAGPLHGVPVSIKSSIAVAGLRCEAGTRLRAGYVAAYDATPVVRLRRQERLFWGRRIVRSYLWRGKPITCCTVVLTIHGICREQPVVQVAEKRRRLPRECRQGEWEAMAADRFVCRHTSLEYAD
jgi:hypothetical protein